MIHLQGVYQVDIGKEEDFQRLWGFFLLVHKVIGIKEEEFNKEREELSSKINELAKEYGELEKKHNKIMDSIKGIIED